MDIMLDSDAVNALRLRFPDARTPDLVLGSGVHAIGRDATGLPGLVPASQAVAQLCVDRRGVWLQVREGARGGHVNGRPVRRMAMLRAGDVVFIDGMDLLLLGDEPEPAPDNEVSGDFEMRVVLRGVGGQHHGRSFHLEQALVVGRARTCNIRIDVGDVAEQHARLEPHPKGVVLRDMGSPGGSVVNGYPVRHALLKPGDQLVIDSSQRFVVESPRAATSEAATADDAADEASSQDRNDANVQRGWWPRSLRRMPWLLLAAVLLSIALSLLLLYGAR